MGLIFNFLSVMDDKKTINKEEKVSIVILNWNGKNDTNECLYSLKNINYKNYEIIVIDNGSTDGSVQFLKREYQNIILIENKRNLGFTGGNNVGIKRALKNGAKYVVLLNNDTIVDKDVIKEMINIYAINPNIGLIGPKVLYYDDPAKIWCAGGHYSKFLGKGKMYGHQAKMKTSFSNIEKVDWISFCVVMIKAEVFENIGLLDNDFFFTSEDLDFCRRAVRKGFICMYTPKAIVRHKISKDSGGLDGPFNIYYQVRNTLLFYKKNRPTIGFIVSFLYYTFISLTYRVLTFIFKGYFSRSKFFIYAFIDFFSGNYGVGKLSNKIISNMKKEKERVKKIGINTRYLQRKQSGIERYIEELIVHLGVIDKENKYILFFNKHAQIPKLPLPDNFRILTSRLPTKNLWIRILWEHIFLWYEIKKNKIDVFHGPAFFVPLLKPKNCKYVITVHDITFVKFPETFTLGTRLYYKLLFPHSLKLADVIITDSESTKNDLIKEYNLYKKNTKVVYLGISPNFLTKLKKEKLDEVKIKYNLPNKYFLFTGVLSPRKNVEKIIEVFSRLKQKEEYKGYKLIIVGRRGWLFENIFNKVKQLNLEEEVEFIDYVPEKDLPAIYNLADLFLFPSLYEGFGFPILEAMAQDTPVITSNISSMPEVAGNAAILVDPKNTEEIESAIEKLRKIPNLRESLIKKGSLQVKKFKWQKTAEKTKQIYDEITK